jgi:hypothetical protein
MKTYQSDQDSKTSEYIEHVETARLGEAEVFQEKLPVRLTDSEVLNVSRNSAEMYRDLWQAEEAKKAAMLQFKDQIESLKTQIADAQSIVRSGIEWRGIYCQQVMHRDLGEVTITRLDTMQIVETRPMTAKERQTAMDL